MAAEVKTEEVFKAEMQKQFYEIIKNVVVTEKATRMIEFENKLVFEVARNATKPMLKLLIENQFSKAVKSVHVCNTVKGTKRAIITFKEEGIASDLAADLGLV